MPKTTKVVKVTKKPKVAKVKEVAVATIAVSPEKQKVISQFAVKTGDTGSPEVQIALLSQRIDKLVKHLETNKKDNHSRRGLLGLVSKRRRLLIYIQGKDEKRYHTLAKKLGIKK